MKKKILLSIAAVAVVAIAAVNVNIALQSNDLSALSLANVEALAQESSCCIGSKFKIDPIDGGWRCLNGQGESCCPIC
jgi:hypothetical protein